MCWRKKHVCGLSEMSTPPSTIPLIIKYLTPMNWHWPLYHYTITLLHYYTTTPVRLQKTHQHLIARPYINHINQYNHFCVTFTLFHNTRSYSPAFTLRPLIMTSRSETHNTFLSYNIHITSAILRKIAYNYGFMPFHFTFLPLLIFNYYF